MPPPTTTGLRNMRSSSTRPSSIAAAARPAPPIETSLSVRCGGETVDQHGFRLIAPKRRTMTAMKFTVELGIGLSFLVQAALPPLVTNRETKSHRRGGSSDRAAIADAALRSRKRNDERTPSGTSAAAPPIRVRCRCSDTDRPSHQGCTRWHPRSPRRDQADRGILMNSSSRPARKDHRSTVNDPLSVIVGPVAEDIL